MRELHLLAIAHGGGEALYRSLTTEQAARLALRLAESAAEAEQQAEEADRKATADLGDPALQRQLVQMGLEHLAGKPSSFAPLLERPAVKRWLKSQGWSQEHP